jgi:hypothetical protein
VYACLPAHGIQREIHDGQHAYGAARHRGGRCLGRPFQLPNVAARRRHVSCARRLLRRPQAAARRRGGWWAAHLFPNPFPLIQGRVRGTPDGPDLAPPARSPRCTPVSVPWSTFFLHSCTAGPYVRLPHPVVSPLYDWTSR